MSSEKKESKGSKEDKVVPPWYYHALAGEIAGMIGAIVCHPFDTTRVRLQMLNTTKKPSTLRFMFQIVQKYGFLSLYKGIAYPLFGYGMFATVSFGINGVMQDYFICK